MNASAVSTETDGYVAFCQRRYDRAMSKADLMDNLATVAADNGEMEVAGVLRDGATKRRDQVMQAAKTVSDRMQRIAAE